MSEWIEHRLGEVCSRLRSGSNITAKDIHESGSFPVFGGNGIRGYAAEANFSGECAIIGRQGAYCGNVRYFIGEARMSEHAVVACAGPSHHTRFLAYLLSNMNLGSLSGQAAQPGLSVKVLAQQSVRMPSRQNQERIAEILGAYDDLIEVNRRRVAVLEEMARGLFEEWFVRFGFPGYEAVEIEHTSDGPLPKGWRWGTASDLVAFDPRTRVPQTGAKPFIPMGHLDTCTSLIASPELREGNSGAKFRNGDTLFARITPCLENGKTGLVRGLPAPDEVGFGSTEFIVMRGDRAGPAYTYCLSRLTAFRDHARGSMSGASGRQRARTMSVAAFAVSIPPTNELLHQFEALVGPMLDLVGVVGETNARLAASRDLLLPRLISGQLSVPAAEHELEEAA